MSHPTRTNHNAKLHLGLIFLLAGLTGLLIFYNPISNKQALLTKSPDAIEATNQSPAVTSKQVTQESIGEAYGKLPLSFEANHGQTDSRVKFLSRGPGYGLYLTSSEAVLSLSERRRPEEQGQVGRAASVLRMKVSGANSDPQILGLDELPGKTNYFTGTDPQKWVADVPTYQKVLYRDIYAGVDLIYYGNQRQLEYDFVVAPRVDPGVIKLKFEGASNLEVNQEGDLVLRIAGEELRQLKPVIYQEMDGARQMVAGNYVIKGRNQVGFELGAYDRSRPLVIDPVLSYSTYLGGNYFDQGYAITVDSAGNAYVAGTTASVDFPTTAGAYQTTYSSPLSGGDGFITKLNAAGDALVYSTFLAGASCNGIAVDAASNAYVTGETGGLNFPITPGAYQTAQWGYELFITKLNATGSALIYSSRFGGNFDDFGRDIALDASGNAYITGWTVCRSPAPTCTFPVVNAFQPVYGGGYNDGFVTKMNASGTALVYSTFLGGGEILNATDDWGEGIAVDSAGSAYVTGFTYSPDFPVTPGAYDTERCGLDAFITKFTPDGGSLVYSTFLGGCSREQGNSLVVDESGNVYITGLTESQDNPFTPEIDGFPVTPGAYQMTGSFDAFVTKLNATGSALIYSTYLGGTDDVDRGWGIAIDEAGNAYVTGDTKSANFPVVNAVQPDDGGGLNDAFVTKLNATGTALVYSTFLGGNSFDEARGIAVSANGDAYVIGSSSSFNFPTTPDAFQPNNGSGPVNHEDAFVVKIVSVDIPTPTHSISGRVTNGTSGMSGVKIALTGGQAGTTTTDGTGNYSFLNLAEGGNYTVKPTKTGYTFAPSNYLYTNLSADQTNQNFAATATAHTISGTVKFGAAGLSGVTVKLTSPTKFTTRTTTTSSTGAYSFLNVPASHNYIVTPTGTGYQFTPASKALTNLSANQTATNFAVKFYSISGQITRTGTTTGISAVTVTLTSPSPAGFPARTAQTGRLGNYKFTNLPAGRNYTIKPTKSGYTFSPPMRSITNLSGNVLAGSSTNFIGTGP
ncbi:MAG: SBBP repeat-containing protein [Pyrinomonadaceae bacterium]